MKNSMLNSAHLEILQHPERWRWMIKGYVEELKSVSNPRQMEWSKFNSHSHPHREVLMPLIGESSIGISGEIYPCCPGTVFYFDAFTPHDHAYPDFAPEMEHMWICFVPNHIFVNLVHVQNGKMNSVQIFDCESDLSGLPDFSKPLEKVWPDFESFNVEFIRLKFFAAIVQLVPAIIENTSIDIDSKNKETLQKKMVEKICAHIRDCGGKGVTLDNLSRITGYSKFHFHRIFKRITGISVHSYVNNCRMKVARELLDAGYSRKEICYELGFSSPSAFSRWSKSLEN